MAYEFNSHVQFIFTVGLEGTGHHLMGSIVTKSPATQRLRTLNVWNAQHVGRLRHDLYSDTNTKSWFGSATNRNNKSGLWNAHCVDNDNDNDNDERSSAFALEESIVQKLKAIETQVKNNRMGMTMRAKNSNATEEETTTTIPLALDTGAMGAMGRYHIPTTWANAAC
jgi:hypothetical protein